MTEDQVLSPSTPTSWIMARLRADALLAKMLGSGPMFPNPTTNWGEGGALAPIHKAGQVPPDHAERFVVVRPPETHHTTNYSTFVPRSMDSTYLVWAETQTDKLPTDKGLDDVLTPMFKRIVRVLHHVEVSEATDGYVLQAEIINLYTPQPAKLSQYVKIGKMGVQIDLISTVANSQ